jgi:hypothetical protein
VEPAEEQAGRLLDRRPEPVSLGSVVVPEPPLQHLGEIGAINRSTVVDVALDLRITVEVDEQFEIITGELPQHQPISLNEHVHTGHCGVQPVSPAHAMIWGWRRRRRRGAR